MSREHEDRFNNLTIVLLTEQERHQLYKSLKRYQRNKDIAKFALTIKEICNTPAKAALLDYIRGYMPRSDKTKFDKFTGYKTQNNIPGMTANSRPSFLGRITIPPSNVLTSASECLVTIYGSRGESMGFSIRGGSEFGLGIYVSNVKSGTPADDAGLRTGDHVIKVNGIDLHCVANRSAVRVLSSSVLLNLIVIRCGKIPEWKVARERVLWKISAAEYELRTTDECPICNTEFDIALGRIVSTPPVSETTSTATQQNVLVERKVIITFTKKSDYIGLNIRGGREYGIGIYVSRVDIGGLASQVGLSAGDQVIRVNDKDCLSVTHSEAVDTLRASSHLIITIRSTRKYPVFKELYAEYTWTDANSLSTTTSGVIVHNRLVTAPGDSSSEKYSHRTRTRESSIDVSPLSVIRSGTDNNIRNSYLEYAIEDLDDSLEVGSEVCYPGDQDIMFRRNYTDTWQDSDSLSDNDAGSDNMTTSWTADKTDSLGHFQPDTDLRDHVLDYETFLEHTALKDQQEIKLHKQQIEPSNLMKDENVVIETVIDEKVTSFTANLKASTNSGSDMYTSETTNHVYSQVHDLTGKTRPNHARSSISSSIYSEPVYATVDKTSKNNDNDSTVVYKVMSNGFSNDNNRKNIANDRDDTPLKEVIESQIERLEARKSHLGSWEITRVTEGSADSISSSSASYESNDKSKLGTWTSLKKKLKGSLRIGTGHKKRSSMPSEDAYSGNGTSTQAGPLRRKSLFERGFGSQIINSQHSDRYNLMGLLEDHARGLLTADEYKAVLRHVQNYHDNKEIERLVELLLAILDKPEKKLLLVDIRNVIAPSHIVIFDNLTAHCKTEGYDKWLTKVISAEETNQTRSVKSQHYVKSHDKIKSNDINHHKPNSADHNPAFSRKGYETSQDSLEVIVLENNDAENRKTSVVENEEEIVYISKHKTMLGLEICGGRNDPNDPRVRVKQVTAGSAASDDKRLQPGVQITKVDGNSLQGVSMEEANSMLQIAFRTKVPVNLGIQIRRA